MMCALNFPPSNLPLQLLPAGLQDENQKVKTIAALTIAALAEASAPFGIESFDDVLEPLWKGIRLLRGKVGALCMLCMLRCMLAASAVPLPACVLAGCPSFLAAPRQPRCCLSLTCPSLWASGFPPPLLACCRCWLPS